MKKKWYSSFDVVKILGIKRITLQDWLQRGFIIPKVEAKGYGTKNVFTKMNIYKIRLFMNLVDSGLSRKEAAKRIKAIPDRSEEDFEKSKHVVFLIDRGTCLFTFLPISSSRFISGIMDSNMAFIEIVNIERVRNQVQEVIKKQD